MKRNCHHGGVCVVERRSDHFALVCKLCRGVIRRWSKTDPDE